MKPSLRLEKAVKKLYVAFHNNTLQPECCKQCAVGNILDQNDSWKHLTDNHGSTQLNYLGRVHQNLGRRFNGYTPLELLQIESEFLRACGYTVPLHHKNKKPKDPLNSDNLFNGLNAVVSLLCLFDNIPNVMDCSKLFDYKTTLHQLSS